MVTNISGNSICRSFDHRSDYASSKVGDKNMIVEFEILIRISAIKNRSKLSKCNFVDQQRKEYGNSNAGNARNPWLFNSVHWGTKILPKDIDRVMVCRYAKSNPRSICRERGAYVNHIVRQTIAFAAKLYKNK